MKGATEMKYYIDAHAWEVIYRNLRKEKGLHTKNEEKLRVFYEAIWYVARTGRQWRFMPPYYRDWRSLHKRFLRWAKKEYGIGCWRNIKSIPIWNLSG